MIAPRTDVVAVFRYKDRSEWRNLPVIAFDDEGAPMVLSDEENCLVTVSQYAATHGLSFCSVREPDDDYRPVFPAHPGWVVLEGWVVEDTGDVEVREREVVAWATHCGGGSCLYPVHAPTGDAGEHDQVCVDTEQYNGDWRFRNDVECLGPRETSIDGYRDRFVLRVKSRHERRNRYREAAQKEST